MATRTLYDEILALPEHLLGEILDGELVITPSSPPKAGRVRTLLGVMIGVPYDRNRDGQPDAWRILWRMETHLGEDVIVPAISGWQASRLGPLGDEYPTIAADWVCEVLIPETARRDRMQKLPIYARHGVPHCWLVDPWVQTIEAYQLENGRSSLHGVYGDADARIPPFEEAPIEFRHVWGKRSPPSP